MEAARKQLRATKADDNRIVSTNAETALSISVAAASITRALKVMDALVGAWERIGGVVKPGVKNFDQRFRTAFSIGEDQVLTTLHERTEAIPDWQPPKGYWNRYPPHRPNGQLVFTIDYIWGEGLRSSWADGKRQRLEEVLDRIFDGLVIQVEDRKRRRLDNECEARQKAVVERRRAEKEKWVQEQKARRESLLQDVGHWHDAVRIRAYLIAMREAIAAGKMRITDEKIYAEWTEWAGWYADHIDPLIMAKPRSMIAAPPINKLIGELDLTFRTRAVLVQLGISDADGLSKLTKEQIQRVEKRFDHCVWRERCFVLEGLGYNTSTRQQT